MTIPLHTDPQSPPRDDDELFDSPHIDPLKAAFVRGRREGYNAMLEAMRVQKAEEKEREMSTVSTEKEDGYKWFTRAVLGIMGTALIGAIVWCSNMNAKVSVLTANFASLADSMRKIEQSLADSTRMRYTSEDASRDRESCQAELRALREDAQQSEKRIRDLELWRAGMGNQGTKP